MATGVEKVCLICKQDCTGRPRTKDDKGRYICQACIDKYGPEKVARIIADTDAFTKPYDDGIDLAAAAAAEAKTTPAELTPDQSCPKCANFMQSSARICMHCGFDRQEKRVIRTKVEKAKADPRSKVSVGEASKVAFVYGALGLGVVMVGAAVLAFAVPEAILVSAAIIGLFYFALPILTCVCQFRDGETTYAWMSLASIVLPFVRRFMFGFGLISSVLWLGAFVAMIFWVMFLNHRGWLKMLWGAFLIALLVFVMAILNMPPEHLDRLKSLGGQGEEPESSHVELAVGPRL